MSDRRRAWLSLGVSVAFGVCSGLAIGERLRIEHWAAIQLRCIVAPTAIDFAQSNIDALRARGVLLVPTTDDSSFDFACNDAIGSARADAMWLASIPDSWLCQQWKAWGRRQMPTTATEHGFACMSNGVFVPVAFLPRHGIRVGERMEVLDTPVANQSWQATEESLILMTW